MDSNRVNEIGKGKLVAIPSENEQVPYLTARESRVIKMMEQGHRLYSVKWSRFYGLFDPNELSRPVELVQRRIVESLKAKGKIKIGWVFSTSEYVLDR